MYGTNDSYVNKGATSSRISLEEYRTNLRAIVAGLLVRGIEPVLMTEPRWADDAPADGLGESPNIRLAAYVEACRAVAAECRVSLVDHFAHWTEARLRGQRLGDWTTDGCHPNPRGRRELAEALRPALRDAFRPAPRAVPFTTRLETVLAHDDGQFLWYHPRADGHPEGRRRCRSRGPHHAPEASEDVGPLFRPECPGQPRHGPDVGGPPAVAELDWVREAGGVNVAVADVTPQFHPRSGKVLAVGAQVRYSPRGEQLEDRPRANQTAYAVLDPKTGRWTRWRRIEMPSGESFNFARGACTSSSSRPTALSYCRSTSPDRPMFRTA